MPSGQQTTADIEQCPGNRFEEVDQTEAVPSPPAGQCGGGLRSPLVGASGVLTHGALFSDGPECRREAGHTFIRGDQLLAILAAVVRPSLGQ